MENPPISILVSRNTTSAIATQDTAVALGQLLVRLRGVRCDRLTPGLASRMVEVRRSDVIPGKLCYDSHCSIPLTEGLTSGRVTLAAKLGVTRPLRLLPT